MNDGTNKKWTDLLEGTRNIMNIVEGWAPFKTERIYEHHVIFNKKKNVSEY